jgi:ABC-2 type transport system ATP-binding protein
MIRFTQVSKSYGLKIKAVDAIDLHVRPGEIFGFLGPNGAGKTTTIKLMTGILPADEGEISLNGYDLKKEPLLAKRSFGLVPDDPTIFPRLKAIEYLRFMGDLYRVPSEKRAERIRMYSERLALDEALTDRIQSYSHGMRQKLMIIGALLHDPEIWIMDEPMMGLDPRSSFVLKEMMNEQTQNGKTVFFSTHVLDVAEKICDRVAVIDRGRILFCGTINEMKNQFQKDGSLESMFLELVNQQESGDLA